MVGIFCTILTLVMLVLGLPDILLYRDMQAFARLCAILGVFQALVGTIWVYWRSYKLERRVEELEEKLKEKLDPPSAEPKTEGPQ